MVLGRAGGGLGGLWGGCRTAKQAGQCSVLEYNCRTAGWWRWHLSWGRGIAWVWVGYASGPGQPGASPPGKEVVGCLLGLCLVRAPCPSAPSASRAFICSAGATSGGARPSTPCVHRWCNQLNPEVKKEPFSQWEDAVIILSHRINGNKWASECGQGTWA